MNISSFLNTLPIMGMGMLGIFAVMALIFVLIVALSRVTATKTQDKE